jgi:hypothetical protein
MSRSLSTVTLLLALNYCSGAVFAQTRSEQPATIAAMASLFTTVAALQEACDSRYPGTSASSAEAVGVFSERYPRVIEAFIVSKVLQARRTQLVAKLARDRDVSIDLCRQVPVMVLGITPSEGEAFARRVADESSDIQKAIRENKLDAVRTALAAGADVYGKTSNGTPLLAVAINLADDSVVNELLDWYKPEKFSGTTERMSAVHSAAKWGRIGILERLLRLGFGVNDRDRAGQTPLHSAVAGGQVQSVQYLLQHGADPNVVSEAN